MGENRKRGRSKNTTKALIRESMSTFETIFLVYIALYLYLNNILEKTYFALKIFDILKTEMFANKKKYFTTGIISNLLRKKIFCLK